MQKKLTTNKSPVRYHRKSSGQGIAEYAAIIAFVAILISLVFAFGPNSLGPALSQAYSQTGQQLNNLSSTAATASS